VLNLRVLLPNRFFFSWCVKLDFIKTRHRVHDFRNVTDIVFSVSLKALLITHGHWERQNAKYFTLHSTFELVNSNIAKHHKARNYAIKRLSN
jgi:hypothetical protein